MTSDFSRASVGRIKEISVEGLAYLNSLPAKSCVIYSIDGRVVVFFCHRRINTQEIGNKGLLFFKLGVRSTVHLSSSSILLSDSTAQRKLHLTLFCEQLFRSRTS